MDRVFDVLERIRALWKQLGELRPGTHEYEALMDRIRARSEEYHALINVPKKPGKSK
jgi:hypothetical protein